MSGSAEDEGSLLSTDFEVGLDGSYRRVEIDAAGTSTLSMIGKGAEREEMEQLLRLAQSSETNERKAVTLEAKLIDQDTALEEQRKQLQKVKSTLAEYEMQSYDKRLAVQRETRTRDTDDVVQEMQLQMTQIQKVLTELQNQSQQRNSNVCDSCESDGGSSGSSSESSSEDDVKGEKE
jgi:rubrerythrin